MSPKQDLLIVKWVGILFFALLLWFCIMMLAGTLGYDLNKAITFLVALLIGIEVEGVDSNANN